jgi:hypothetical protein
MNHMHSIFPDPRAGVAPSHCFSAQGPSMFRGSRFGLSVLCGLVCVSLFSGCPQAPGVEVVIKNVEGAAAGDGTSGEAGATAVAGYGSLTGTVTYDGDAPSRPPLINTGDTTVKLEDRAVCTAMPIPDESLLVNAQNKGVANVVIFLEKRPAQIKPELEQPPSEPVLFDQKGCRFLPHVLTVRVGQPLLVVSDDPITHNTRTSPKRNASFNQSIQPNNRTGVPCNYKKAESAPLTVVCDFHNWMKAYHFPVDHPYVAVTDADGKFKIEGLPAGKHAFNVWHERSSGSGQLLERRLQVTIEVDQETVRELNYGGTDFAGAKRPSNRTAGRMIAYDRLLDGGTIEVSKP